MKPRWKKLRAGRWKESENTKEDGTPTSMSLSPVLTSHDRNVMSVRSTHGHIDAAASCGMLFYNYLGISTVSHEELRVDISSAQPRSRCPSPSCDIWPAPL